MNATETKSSMNEPGDQPQGLKDFMNTHKNVTGESWMKTKDGFSVRFNSDDVRTTIYYDKKGNWSGA
jgi:hypothetical protein